MRAGIWFLAGMLAEMNLHVATLCENSSAPIEEALERSLESVCFVVFRPNGLAHLLRDGLEPLFASQLLFFVGTCFIIHLVVVTGLMSVAILVLFLDLLDHIRSLNRDELSVRIVSYRISFIGNWLCTAKLLVFNLQDKHGQLPWVDRVVELMHGIVHDLGLLDTFWSSGYESTDLRVQCRLAKS